jgi:hypothetical protein
MRVVAVVEATVDGHAFTIALKISAELNSLRECHGAGKHGEQSCDGYGSGFDFHFLSSIPSGPKKQRRQKSAGGPD